LRREEEGVRVLSPFSSINSTREVFGLKTVKIFGQSVPLHVREIWYWSSEAEVEKAREEREREEEIEDELLESDDERTELGAAAEGAGGADGEDPNKLMLYDRRDKWTWNSVE
jgi:hypothetical protein